MTDRQHIRLHNSMHEELNEKLYQYNVILLDCKTFNMKILFTCNQLNDAIQKMNNYVDSSFELSEYLKAYHENTLSINIYKYFYFRAKEMINKIQIIEFKSDIISL